MDNEQKCAEFITACSKDIWAGRVAEVGCLSYSIEDIADQFVDAIVDGKYSDATFIELMTLVLRGDKDPFEARKACITMQRMLVPIVTEMLQNLEDEWYEVNVHQYEHDYEDE